MIRIGRIEQRHGQPGGKDGAPVAGIQRQKAAPLVRRPTAHKDRQPKDTINDGGHASQIVNIGLDDAVDQAAVGIFFQVDRCANADGEGKDDGDQDDPQRAKSAVRTPASSGVGGHACWLGNAG